MIANDKEIRKALRSLLKERQISHEPNFNKGPRISLSSSKIFDEFCINHGSARVDVAVLTDSFMHGYEIKSDSDNVRRLPLQVEAYNSVFDKMTLVVGEKLLMDSIKLIPEWWGIKVAKFNSDKIVLRNIRDPENNPEQDCISIARLLWKNEALNILSQKNQDKGFRSKQRELIYQRLSELLDLRELKKQVISVLKDSRDHYQSALQLKSCDD